MYSPIHLCEKANAANCVTATVTVIVTAPAIVAQDDTIAGGNGATGNTNAGNVLNNNGNGNDTLNSTNVTISQVNLTVTTPATPINGGPVPSISTATGQVSVPAGTPAGNYTLVYSICEKVNPTNCDPANVTVTVTAPPIVAQDDTIAGGNGANGNTNAGNVLNNNGNGNDTLNGANVTISQVNLTVTTPATPINGGPVPVISTATGQVSVPAGTPAGNYTLVYSICEKVNPTNCDPATIIVSVTAPKIDAVNDDYTTNPIPSFPGGTTASVILNDTFNNLPATIGNSIGQVKLTGITVPTGLTLNADGTIKVLANTLAGTYLLTYSICDVLNPSNCDTAIATVLVTSQRPAIAVIKTATSVDENGDGFATVGETVRYNFSITNTGNVPLTNVYITDLLPGLVLYGNPISLGVGQQDTNSFYGIYKIKQEDADTGFITNQAKGSGTSPLGIVVSDLSDDTSNESDGATVLSVKNCVVEVSNALTPNGDGKNEYFHVEGLDCFSQNTVEIYNRWGVLVFETSKYNNVDNVFNGFSRGRTTIRQSEGLPDGTYYYVIKYVDFSGNAFKKAGYLYLKN